MKEQAFSLSKKTVELTQVLWAAGGVVFLVAGTYFGMSSKIDSASAMAIETKADLAALRADREKTLNEYYKNIGSINTKLESMGNQMDRMERKVDHLK